MRGLMLLVGALPRARGLVRSLASAPRWGALAAEAGAGGDAVDATPAGVINWYPGHIARAERELRAYLKRVDVVVEARDARIGATTAHPDLKLWLGEKSRVIVFTHADLAPRSAQSAWASALDEPCYFVDAKRGGTRELRGIRSALADAAQSVNEKRAARGIAPRAVRVAVVGYPNVGKSALINRLAGRAKAKSENKPGVTRHLRWIKSESGAFDLLDSPGIIPAKQLDNAGAARLAMCGDIGDASYDARLVAEALLDAITRPGENRFARDSPAAVRARYGNFTDGEASAFERVVDGKFAGDAETAAVAVLADFRAGRLGLVALEGPPGAPRAAAPAPPRAAPAAPAAPATAAEEADADLDRRIREGDFSGW